MISGRKVAGYGFTRDAAGREVESPHRQCAHCQAMFPYFPREQDKTVVFNPSTKEWIKVDTGFCLKCMAMTCMRAACNASCPGPYEAKAQ